MEDIIRKQMKDVTVPQNDIIRRPQTVPEPYVAPIRDDEGDRIGKNPFFEKPQKKAPEQQKEIGAGKGVLFALLFALLLALGFFTANYFAMATIEVVPISRNINLDNEFFAKTLKFAVEGDLVYNFATSTEEKSKDVSATIEKRIQKKASGKVTIFNEYNDKSQRLIRNTRFEDEKTRKIYHIDESVVVPGTKIIDGKIIPGSVDAVVYAAGVGDEYNIGTSNFTIPGFKGDPRYSKFRAVSKPDSPIKGGLDEVRKVPSDESVASAQEELKKDLKKIVVEKARVQIPDSMSLFPGSIIIKFEEVPRDYTVPETTNVSMRATVSVFFFDTDELTKKIAELLSPADRENPFKITNMSALDFKFVAPVNNVVLSDLNEIRFHLVGSANFVGQIDSKKISADFVGRSKREINEIIKKQINVSDANVIVRPMWKKVFPSDPAKITVKIVTK